MQPTIHENCLKLNHVEDHFASPASVTDDVCDLKTTLGEKILFFENVSRTVNSSVDPVLPKGRVCELRRSPSPVRDEDASFTSNDLDSISSDSLEIPASLNEPSLPSSRLKSLIDRLESHSGIFSDLSLHSKVSQPLPSSSQIIQDFTRFPTRPSCLQVNPIIPSPSSINSQNLYKNHQPLFSKSLLDATPVLFRGPGMVLDSKPTLNLSNSILTEVGVKYYITVSASPQSCWVLLKSLSNPLSEINQVLKNDKMLASFILSDISTEIYKRTPFLMFNRNISIGKIIGQCLCICINGKCIKAIRIGRIEKRGNERLSVDGTELEFSCETERNEWFKVLNEL